MFPATTDAIATINQTPLPELVERLGVAIAQAQFAMDKSAAEIAKYMSATDNGVDIDNSGKNRSLLSLGFTPTFYQITEAVVEAKVTFSTSEMREITVGAKVGINIEFFTAAVNAAYTAKYSFDAAGSSSITARFASIPPPSLLTEILRESVSKDSDRS